MIARPPQLSEADQINSTLHFYREMNRLGLTSAVDAGGGGHAFPEDYVGSQKVAKGEAPEELSVRLGYYLFAQTAGKEAEDFLNWTQNYQAQKNEAEHLEHGFELEGGGEFLAHSIGDWENFLAPQPRMEDRIAEGERHKLVVHACQSGLNGLALCGSTRSSWRNGRTTAPHGQKTGSCLPEFHEEG